MKDTTIIVKTEDKMKEALSKLAADNKRQLSDYVRLLYQHAIEKKLKF